MSNKGGLYEAKGHIAKIIQFDEETVLLPLNASEANRLFNAISKTIKMLEATNDFPEKEEYENLKYNLQTAFMHTLKTR